MYFVLILLSLLTSISGGSGGILPVVGKDNTTRRSNMARILSQITEYQSNNAGKVPVTEREMDIFVERYVGAGDQGRNGTVCKGDQFCDPDGKPYIMNTPTELTEDLPNALGSASFETDHHEIHYYTHATCDYEEGSLKYSSGARDVAIMYILKNGSIYCGDNH